MLRSCGKITTTDRHVRRETRQTKRIKATTVEGEDDKIVSARIEVDNRADTSCLGINFRMIEDSGVVCNVNGFHGSFDTIKDVPIARGATGFHDPKTGRKYILFVNQGLYFGDKMDHSLLNPNQVRHFHIPVSDDIYDQSRKFGIDHPDVFLPFDTEGATVFLQSFRPTMEQLEDPSYTHIELTDPKREWDPHKIVMGFHDRFVQRVDIGPTEDEDLLLGESEAAFGGISDCYVPDKFLSRVIKSAVISPDLEEAQRVRISKLASTPREDTIGSTGIRPNDPFSSGRKSTARPERLGKLFGISLDKAKRMMNMVTFRGVSRQLNPTGTGVYRRFPTSNTRFRSEEPKLPAKFYMDWVSANVPSIHDDTGAFFIGHSSYVECYPRPKHTSKDAARALSDFMVDVGIPSTLQVDSAGEFVGHKTEFVDLTKKKGIDVRYVEPHRHGMGPLDTQIREVKKKWQEDKCTLEIPKKLWNYGIKYNAAVRQIVPLDGRRTGWEETHGTSPDIDEMYDFGFYDLVWYLKGSGHASLSDDAKDLGRWLGISRKVGAGMCYYILTREGNVISESTVMPVTEEQMRNPDIKAKVEAFNAAVKAKLDEDDYTIPVADGMDSLDDTGRRDFAHLLKLAHDGREQPTGNGNSTEMEAAYAANVEDSLQADGEEMPQLDNLIGATIKMETPEGNVKTGTVKKRAVDDNGRGVGTHNDNTLLDSRQYEVEFEDGSYDRYQANVIAENIYSQTDDEGRETLLLDEIYGHRKDGNAIPISRGHTLSSNGEPRRKITTAGWHIKVRWKDGSTDELPLSVVKESNPIELAEYATVAGIQEEPAFKWWVPHALRTRNRIIKKARVIKKTAKYWRTKSKFGIELPHSVEEAYALDDKNGNTFWRDALKKEMGNVKIAFRAHEKHTYEEVKKGLAPELKGYTEIECHVVFDIKLDFTRKARFVAGGHKAEAPACMTYSSVVSRDSVRLAFMIAALNDLEVSSTDIGNAYLNAECREKVWFKAGLECGQEDQGKVMIITRALYVRNMINGQSKLTYRTCREHALLTTYLFVSYYHTGIEKLRCSLESHVLRLHHQPT